MKIKTSEFEPQLKLLAALTRNYGYITITSNTVSAVNDGIKVVLNIRAEDAEDFVAITVFSKPLYEAVKKAKTDTVDLSVNENHLILKAGRSRFKFICVNTDEVNIVTDVESDASVIETKIEAFERLIDRVWYAAEATKEGNTRLDLQGIHMHTIDGQLVSVATDGHRLARYAIGINTLDVSPPELGPIAFTVPNIAIKVIKGLLDLKEGNADLKVRIGTGKLNVSTDYGAATTTLIEQSFPDYKAIMPDTFGPMVELDCERFSKLLDSFKEVMPGNKAVRAYFNGVEVEFSTRNEDNKSGEETLDYDGENDAEYCMFNAGYMMDAIRQCECLIKFSADSPILLRGLADTEYRAMVMPMRT